MDNVVYRKKQGKRCSGKLLFGSVLIVTVCILILVYMQKQRRQLIIFPVDSWHKESSDKVIPPSKESAMSSFKESDAPESGIINDSEQSVYKVEDPEESSGYTDTRFTHGPIRDENLQTHTPVNESLHSDQDNTADQSTDPSLFQRLFHWGWGDEDDNNEVSKTPEFPQNNGLSNSSSGGFNLLKWIWNDDSSETSNTDVAVTSLYPDSYNSNSSHTVNSSSLISFLLQNDTTFDDTNNVVLAEADNHEGRTPSVSLKDSDHDLNIETGPVIATELPPCNSYSSDNIREMVPRNLNSARPFAKQMAKDLRTALVMNHELGVIDGQGEVSIFTLIAIEMGRKVIVVEPNYDCMEQLRRVLEVNNVTDSVTIRHASLSDKQGQGRFVTYEGKHFVAREVREGGNKENSHLSVKTITLNDLSAQLPFSSALIYLDVMAFTPFIFKSAELLFNNVKIHYVFMKWDYDKRNDEVAADIISFLSRQNFQPRERLENGFSLLTAFYRYWPENVVWVNQYPW